VPGSTVRAGWWPLREFNEAAQILVVLQPNRLQILLLGLDHRLLRPDLVIGVAQTLGHVDRQLSVSVELRLILEFLALPADLRDLFLRRLIAAARSRSARLRMISISFSLP
jgi:hypothetical protein